MNERRFQRKLDRMRMKGERQKAKHAVKSKYEKYYHDRDGAKVSNVMLVVIVIAITVYTIASFLLALVSGINIDSTLTTCFYSFWTIEIISLAGIKISKVKKEKDKPKNEGDVE